ncbi:MAG: sulfatase-like hydrolase/transferase, partial [Bacteroidota bacterium]
INSFLNEDGAINLTRMYAGSSICTPSRASLLTGCIPDGTGLYQVGPNLSNELLTEEYTIGEMLKSEGYTTGIYGKWHLSQSFAFGFDLEKYGFDVGVNATGIVDNQVSSAEWYWKTHVRDFLEEVKDTSFFLYWAPVEPHFLQTGTAEFTDPMIGGVDSFRNRYDGIHYPDNLLPEHYGYSQFPATPDQFKFYGACVSEMDWAFGQMVQWLKDNGLFENTIILFSSDNGGAKCAECIPTNYTKDNLLSGNKSFLYEGGIRVPGLIRWNNGGWTNRSIDLPISFYDIVPTIASVLGHDDPKIRQLHGENINEILKGNSNSRNRELFFQLGVGATRLQNPLSADQPPEGGVWPNGNRNVTFRNHVAILSPDGTKKIIAGYNKYPGNQDDPFDWRVRESIDPNSFQYYRMNESDAHPQNENLNVYDLVTGAERIEFKALEAKLIAIAHYIRHTMPYRDWNNKEGNLD